MIVQGLENNYYLAGNDIWMRVYDLPYTALKMELSCINLSTAQTLKTLTLYPSPDNDFRFNISEPIRALFPEPNHLINNNLQQYAINIKAHFLQIYDQSPQEETLAKYFIRGFKKKQTGESWNLQSNEPLIIKPWCEWAGVTLPGFAQKIQGSSISNFVPTNVKVNRLNYCDYKIIKFLNSLGGYQFYVFENWTIKQKAKSKGYAPRMQINLQEQSFKSLGTEVSEVIELQAKTPFEMQDVITDLVMSSEVFMYNPDGQDENSIWIALDFESNSSEKDNQALSYDNKLSFNIINNINVWL